MSAPASSKPARIALVASLALAPLMFSCGGEAPEAPAAATVTPDVAAEAGAATVEGQPQAAPARTTSSDRIIAPPGRQRALVLTIKGWLSAWSEQRVADYLGYYSESFEPSDGMSRRRWESERQQRVSAPRFVQVEMTALETELLDANRARAVFLQHYRSDGYTDTVRKRLDLAWEADRWRIVGESSEGAS